MPWSQETLIDALQVRPVGEGGFRAALPGTDEGMGRVFGGVLLALAVNAAVRTVDTAEFGLHSLHAHFLRPAGVDEPFDLRVDRWRDGRSFATRQVTLLQAGRHVMSATASFHVDEPGAEYQVPMDSDVPDPDGLAQSEWNEPFEARDAGAVVGDDGVFRSTRRTWLRLPRPVRDDPGLHATLAAYASDMTGSSFRPLSLDEWGTYTDASLDHAMWLHRPFRIDDWVLFDLNAVVNAGARSLVRGAMFDRQGRLCLSIAQELLIRKL